MEEPNPRTGFVGCAWNTADFRCRNRKLQQDRLFIRLNYDLPSTGGGRIRRRKKSLRLSLYHGRSVPRNL